MTNQKRAITDLGIAAAVNFGNGKVGIAPSVIKGAIALAKGYPEGEEYLMRNLDGSVMIYDAYQADLDENGAVVLLDQNGREIGKIRIFEEGVSVANEIDTVLMMETIEQYCNAEYFDPETIEEATANAIQKWIEEQEDPFEEAEILYETLCKSHTEFSETEFVRAFAGMAETKEDWEKLAKTIAKMSAGAFDYFADEITCNAELEEEEIERIIETARGN